MPPWAAHPAPTAAPATCAVCGTRERNGICQPCAEELIEEGELQEAAARAQTRPHLRADIDSATSETPAARPAHQPAAKEEP